jgi:O-antigen/teichoic acid export membrane protein
MIPLLRARLTGATARNTGWMLLAYGARLGLQAAAFLLLARTLGAEGFGAFAASLAMVSILGPFVEMGAYSLIIRDTSAGVPTARAAGNTILSTLVILPAGFALLLTMRLWLLEEVPWGAVLGIGVAGFVGSKLVTFTRASFIAHGRMQRGSVLELVAGTSQLLAAIALYVTGGGLAAWAWLYCAQSLIAGAFGLTWFISTWGMPSWQLSGLRQRLVDGLQFAVGLAAQSAYVDVDKTMLARLSSLSAAGIYSAAHRIVAVSLVPLMAFVSAVYPSLFVAGRNGYPAARRLAWRYVPVVGAYGVLAAAGIWLAAPFLPGVLGPDFERSVTALRILSVLLVIQSMQYPFADALSASGRQMVRSIGQGTALATSVILNLLLIPRYGWIGAAWAALATHTLLLLYLAFIPLLKQPRGESLRPSSVLQIGA